MGKRHCIAEGCNALEFRTLGFCLKHKESHQNSLIENTNEAYNKIPLANKVETVAINDSLPISWVPFQDRKYKKQIIWFLIGFLFVPLSCITVAIIGFIISGLLDNYIISYFILLIVIPMIYITGIIWGFTKNGPEGFALGILISISYTHLIYFLLFWGFPSAGSGGTWN